jgi:delta-aminolevulinic acid dehydratase/porphobilinogen synthase
MIMVKPALPYLAAIKRVGADAIITYFAVEVAPCLAGTAI